MGNPFKKDVTEAGMGSEPLYDQAQLEEDLIQSKKDAIKQWVFAGANAAPLHEYLMGVQLRDQTKIWDRAFSYAYSGKYTATGIPKHTTGKNTEPSRIFPNLYIKREWREVLTSTDPADTQIKQEFISIADYMGLGADALVKQLKESMGEDYNKVRWLVLHLGVGFFTDTVVETKGNYASLAYLYRYLTKGIVSEQERFRSYRGYLGDHGYNRTSIVVEDNLLGIDSELGHPYAFIPVNNLRIYSFEALINDMVRKVVPDIIVDWFPAEIRNMPRESYASIYITHNIPITMKAVYLFHHYADGSWGVWINNMYGATQKGWMLTSKMFPVPIGYGKTYYDQSQEPAVFALDWELIQDYSVTERGKLYTQSLRLTWFTTETFSTYRSWVAPTLKWLLQTVSIVISVGSGGLAAPLSQTIMKLATSFAVTLLIDKTLDFAVKIGIISPKTAAALRVILTLAVGLKGAGWDFSKILTAPNIMKVVNASFNYMNKRNEMEIQEVQKRQAEEALKHQDRMKALAEKQKMADLGVTDNPKYYLDMPSFHSTVNLFETPEMMYARHYNFNVVGISQGLISNLADGLRYRQVDRIQQVKDVTEEIEDVLLIT